MRKQSEDAQQGKARTQELEEQLSASGASCSGAEKDREKELKLERLRQVEALWQQFDRERERHCKKVEKSAAFVAAL